MNSSTPSTTCTYSLATDPGAPSDQSPASAISTPKTTSVHSAAVSVATTIGDSAVSTPITTAVQSCQRRHVRLVIATISPSEGTPRVCNMTGRPVKNCGARSCRAPPLPSPAMDDRLAYDLATDFDTTERIRDDTDGLAEAAAGNLGATVPGCPGWSVADLAWHLLEVQYFWSWVVDGRRQGTDGYAEPPRPPDAELPDALRAGVGRLVEVLRAADPGAPVFTWASRKDAGCVVRHQVQEAAVHHWDAASAAGRDIALDAAAATDGVEEFLRYSSPFRVRDAAPVGGPLVLIATDSGFGWTVEEDGDGTARWRRETSWTPPGAAVLRALAGRLLLFLDRRKGVGQLEVTGDAGVAERVGERKPAGRARAPEPLAGGTVVA